MNYKLIIVATIVSSFIGIVYWYLYYKNMEKVLKKSGSKLLRVSPRKLSAFLLVFLLCTISINSLIYARTTEEKLIMIDDRYSTMNFNNEFIEIVYTEYNHYFAGIYYENNNTIVCITKDSPDELIKLAATNGQEIKKVDNSYNDLLALHRLIATNKVNMSESHENYNESMRIYIDIRENKVILGTTLVDEYSKKYGNYVDEGMLKIIQIGKTEFRLRKD